MANLPRDKEFLEVIRINKVDLNSYPIEVTLKAFYDYMLTQADRTDKALRVFKEYKESK